MQNCKCFIKYRISTALTLCNTWHLPVLWLQRHRTVLQLHMYVTNMMYYPRTAKHVGPYFMLFFYCRTLYHTVLSFVMHKTNTNGILLFYVFFRMQLFFPRFYFEYKRKSIYKWTHCQCTCETMTNAYIYLHIPHSHKIPLSKSFELHKQNSGTIAEIIRKVERELCIVIKPMFNAVQMNCLSLS
jgi:hypothetical protein